MIILIYILGVVFGYVTYIFGGWIICRIVSWRKKKLINA